MIFLLGHKFLRFAWNFILAYFLDGNFTKKEYLICDNNKIYFILVFTIDSIFCGDYYDKLSLKYSHY